MVATLRAAPVPSRQERADRAWSWLTRELGGQSPPPFLVFLGLGDGSVLGALEQRSPETRVLALEPDARQAAAFVAAAEWQQWRDSGRLLYLADPDYRGADQAWRMFPPGVTEPVTIVHPDLALGHGVARAAQRLKRILEGVAANADARRRFAPRYLVNAIRNVPAMCLGTDVRALDGAYRGVPAIVAAAGPSLDNALETLRATPGRGLLIAADTALRPLLMHGLAPALVAALDPAAKNARHFQSLPDCPGTCLVSELALDRLATRVFDSRTFWFRASEHEPWPWLNELGLEIGRLDVWGSVLTAALQAAYLAGCDPIVIVGADLSFTGGRPYARGTSYEFDWACSLAAGDTLENAWRATTASSEPIEDLHGRPASTTRSMISVRDWIVAFAAQSGRRIINATGAGILHGTGIEQAPLGDVLTARVGIEPPARLLQRSASSRTRDLRASALAVRDRLRSREAVDDALIARWTSFSGGGFDGAAVAAALDEAAAGLELARPTPVRSAPIPWNDADLSPRLAALLPRLPEAVGCIASRPQVDPDARAQRLTDAWTLLCRIAEATLDAPGDLERASDAGPVGRRSVCHAYMWPETTRWAVVMFQALVREAAAIPERAATHSLDGWCSRPVLSGTDFSEDGHHVNAACACARLLLEWVEAAGAPSALCAGLAESLRIAADETPADDDGRTRVGLPLTVEVSRNHVGRPETHVTLSAPAVSFVRTGALEEGAPRDPSTRWIGDARVLLELAASDATLGRIRPRLVTREGGVNRLFVAYATPNGVVCVRPHTTDSVLVTADGAIHPHRTWPRAIGMELPFGESGAVAWSNGLSRWPEIDPPYVMYQRREGGEIAVEELPYRPCYGQWWRGRLYWSCFSRIEGWQGVVSWAPGERVREELPGVTSWAVHPDGDALVVHPCDFTPARGFSRAVRPVGWRLASGGFPSEVPLGSFGPVSCRADGPGWTATTHPDRDVVCLESLEGRRLSLVCPAPLGAAWAGTSLLVGTLQGEVLLFDDLAGVLDRPFPGPNPV